MQRSLHKNSEGHSSESQAGEHTEIQGEECPWRGPEAPHPSPALPRVSLHPSLPELCSGLCYCFTGELSWYSLLWNLLTLGWSWFQCRNVSFWVSSCLLIFHGIRSSLMFSSFGFRPPASGFQSFSYSSLKTSPSIQHQ